MTTSIALDIEGVLADVKHLVKKRYEFFDDEHQQQENWDFETDRRWQAYMGLSDAIWRHNHESIPLFDYALPALTEAALDHFDMDIVTNRNHVDEQVEDWLTEKGIHYNDLVINDREISKSTLDYDIYIDDNPNLHGYCNLLLVDQPWNQSVDTEGSWTRRVHSAEDALWRCIFAGRLNLDMGILMDVE